ncbi:IucA/IucC family C-terminal-domain containing protein [Paenisporosarcina cavernae]|uniref:Aerobactin siderophore biosynthesis IucA/IucC-like C-terminal domain-containing protein n=1 Tax=Paenisporosarcina cavernae TaxID=2320858 RepID=A0A385YYE0_9BACL|nr:IucA/IucC family C-terminal-domain containing protein [Paenisporosarcina cavernae]AYC30462.1 hypothetical protein D3873_11695 [Paenisporosarcina cavernae]
MITEQFLQTETRWGAPTQDAILFHWKDLFHDEKLSSLYAELQSTFGYSSLPAAVSVVGKRIGYSTTLILLMKTHAVKSIRLEEVVMYWNATERDWIPTYYFPIDAPRNEEPLAEWVISHLLESQLLPLINQLAKTKGVSKYVLWENIAVYWRWLYVEKFQEPTIFQELSNIPAEHFGIKENPLLSYDRQLAKIGKRRTCCLSYMNTKNSSYCKTCPLNR